MDYIKKLETNAFFYIYWAIFVFYIYCLYQIPIVSIMMTVFIGVESLAIFGAQKKKTIPIYLYIVFNILVSIFYLLMTCGQVYNYLTEAQPRVDYGRIGFILLMFLAFTGFLTKAVHAIKAVKMMNEEKHVLAPLLSNPV